MTALQTENQRPRGLRALTMQKAAPYVFISPWYLLFVTFVVLPVCESVWFSLQDTVGLKSRIFVGLSNYSALSHDGFFGKSLFNSAVFALGSLMLQIPLALALAIVLNSSRLRGKVLFRFAFFSPVLVAGVFIAIIFNLVLNNEYGLLNYLLGALGINTAHLKWLQDDHLVLIALILIGVWRWTGFNMVYFLAGLQAVRQELYEAASLDGAGGWRSFVYVTLPGIRSMLLFVTVMSVIGSLQLFDLPYILLNGPGPNNAGLTTVMYLYQQGFEFGRLGYAAAIGWTLFAVIFVVSSVQMRVMRASMESA